MDSAPSAASEQEVGKADVVKSGSSVPVNNKKKPKPNNKKPKASALQSRKNSKTGVGSGGGGAGEAGGEDERSFRKILMNELQTRKYLSNVIRSGKYTCYNFIFKFLYEQFRRYSNIFFACICCMQVSI